MSGQNASLLRRAAAVAERASAAVMDLVELPMRRMEGALGPRRIPWFFLLPNLVLFGLFSFAPTLVDVFYAATGGTSLLPRDRPYVGVENFRQLLSCRDYLDPNSCAKDLFWRSVYNTLWFVVLQVTAMVALSLATALCLNRRIVARGFFRAVFFYPVLLSPVVVALLWKWVLQRQGILNAALDAIDQSPVNWLVDSHWAFFWSVFVSIWAHMGFYTLILLAGLQAIPRDVYEAAEMDSTSHWRVLWRITLPLLLPNLLVVLVLALIRAVQAFDEVFVLTGGGPGSATLFLVQYIYEVGFAQQIRQYGLAAAASLLLASALVVLTLLQLRLGRRGVRD